VCGTRVGTIALAIGGVALVAGCSALRDVRGLTTSTQPTTAAPTTTTNVPPSTAPATTTTTTSPLPYTLPRVGGCREAPPEEVLAAAVDPRGEIPCGAPHGSETVAVLADAVVAMGEHPGDRDGIPGGLAERVAADCGRAFDAYLGSSPSGTPGRPVARLELAWFVPPAPEWELGARWVRCDAFVAAVPGQTATFAGTLRGALAGDVVPLPLAACFTRSLARTRCDAAHAYEAISHAVLPDGEERPDDDALGAVRVEQCDRAAARAIGVAAMAEQPELVTDLLAPSSREWAAGARAATCMVTAADGRLLDDSVRGIGATPPPLTVAVTTTTRG
jgi:hypothetical protein